MSRHDPSGDRGAAALEFGILLPLLALIVFAVVPFGLRFIQFNRVDAAIGTGMRYATSALANPANLGASGSCPEMRRKRSAAEVAQHIALASDGLIDPSDVTITIRHDTEPGTTRIDPCTALAGSDIHIAVDATIDVGPIGDTVNALTALFGGSGAFDSLTRTFHADGVIE